MSDDRLNTIQIDQLATVVGGKKIFASTLTEAQEKDFIRRGLLPKARATSPVDTLGDRQFDPRVIGNTFFGG